MNENIFRILAAIILFTGVGISTYYRRKADRESGEKVSRRVDGNIMMSVIKIFGLLLWFSPLIYLLNPQWMAWSKIGLPDELRWLGVILGVLCVARHLLAVQQHRSVELHPPVPREPSIPLSQADPIAGCATRFTRSDARSSSRLG